MTTTPMIIVNFIYSLILLGALINLNEATLLENVKQRYLKDKIYVNICW